MTPQTVPSKTQKRSSGHDGRQINHLVLIPISKFRKGATESVFNLAHACGMASRTALLVLAVSLHSSRHQTKEWTALPFEQGVVVVHKARQFVNFLFVTGS